MLTALTLAALLPAAPQSPFVAGASSKTQITTGPVVAADFDGDGLADVLCGGEGVALLHGNGDGTYGAANVLHPEGTVEAVEVHAHDFDQDGNMDALVVHADGTGTPGLEILLNDGQGALTAQLFLAVPNPTHALLGDFDEDGRMDIATHARSGGNLKIRIYAGDGAGGFSLLGVPAGSWSNSFAAADLDLDGHLDLVAMTSTPGIFRFLAGNGDGTFEAPVSTGVPENGTNGNYATPMLLEDVDGDGLADLILGGTTVLRYTGLGGASFGASSQLWPEKTWRFDHGDLDGDGHADLALGTIREIALLRGDGTGAFEPYQTLPQGYTLYTPSIADLTGNGRMDLVVGTGPWVSAFTAREGLPGYLDAGGFLDLRTNSASPVVIDVNMDGIDDLVSSGQFTVDALLGDGEGGFTQTHFSGVSHHPGGRLAVARLNNDPFPDAIVGTAGMTFHEGTGNGEFASPLNFGVGVAGGTREVLTDNLDSDWMAEVLFVARDRVYVVNDLALEDVFDTQLDTRSAALGDVDGDGMKDLVVLSGVNPSRLAVHARLNQGEFAPHVPSIHDLPRLPTHVRLVDMDGDGHLDAVTSHSYLEDPGRICVSLGDGTGHFAAPLIFATPQGARHLMVGDLDLDGHPDVVAEMRGAVAIFLGTGSGMLTLEGVHPIGRPSGASYDAFNAALIDADRDGRLDLAAPAVIPDFSPTGSADGRLALLLNRAVYEPATFCTPTPSSTGSPALLSFSGTTSLSTNELTLHAAPLPAPATGLFFYGAAQPPQPIGNGFRCIGGALYRLPAQVGAPGTTSLTQALDLTALPSGGVSVGDTWSFQAWYRDPSGGGALFNVSDALSLTFAP